MSTIPVYFCGELPDGVEQGLIYRSPIESASSAKWSCPPGSTTVGAVTGVAVGLARPVPIRNRCVPEPAHAKLLIFHFCLKTAKTSFGVRHRLDPEARIVDGSGFPWAHDLER